MSTEILIEDDNDDSYIDINETKSTNEKLINNNIKYNFNKTDFNKNIKLIQKSKLYLIEKLYGVKKLFQKNPSIIKKNIISNKIFQENIKKLENITNINKNNILMKKEIININNISKIENGNNNKILNQKRNREEKEQIEKEKTQLQIKNMNYLENESESESENSSSSLLSSESEKYNEYQNYKKTITINRNVEYNIQKPKKKSILVYELLKRWWYALPKLLPDDYDCKNKLKENKLRIVNLIDWKKEPIYDSKNYEKCIELPGFKYVYCNSNGEIFDFRPEEKKPSFNSLMKLPENKLYEYIINALKNQIEILNKENGFYNKKLIEELNDELKKNEIIYNLIKNQ